MVKLFVAGLLVWSADILMASCQAHLIPVPTQRGKKHLIVPTEHLLPGWELAEETLYAADKRPTRLAPRACVERQNE